MNNSPNDVHSLLSTHATITLGCAAAVNYNNTLGAAVDRFSAISPGQLHAAVL